MVLMIARQLVITLVPAILMLMAVVMVSMFSQINIGSLTRDVAAIADIHPLTGALSTLGFFLWCAAASSSLFAAMVLQRLNQTKTFWFLFCSALLSTYLMMDDAFLFHEALVSRYLGINETVFLAVLGFFVLAYLAKFKKIILTTRYGVLLLGLGFLFFSVAFDVSLQLRLWRLGDWQYFIEDGTKWLGIASWCSYYVHTSYLLVINASTSPKHANS